MAGITPDRFKQVAARTETLSGERTVAEAKWQEIRNVILPAGEEFGPVVRLNAPGSKLHGAVYDSTGEQAQARLSSALHGMMTNPAQKWMGLRTVRRALMKQRDIALWLDIATQIMLDVFNSRHSRFGPQGVTLYDNLGGYGTGAMFVGERPARLPFYSARPLREILLAESADEVVDTCYRDFTLTAAQAVGEFKDKAGAKVIKAAGENNAATRRFRFAHAIEPRRLRDHSKADKRNMPWTDTIIGFEDKVVIRDDGYREFPLIAPRWKKHATEAYGRGPGDTALADVKMLQRTMLVTIRAAEKAIDPPLLVPDDGILQRPNLNAAQITPVRADLLGRAGDPIRPIQTNSRPDIGEDFMAGVRQRVGSAFHNDLLLTARDPRMTATQVLEIAEEQLRVLGPTLGRLQIEYLAPLIDRTFAILLRHGFFPEPPEELKDEALEVEYVSPIANAQRLAEVQGIVRTHDVMGPMIDRRPDLLDVLDLDEELRHVASLTGMPPSLLRSRDDVGEIRRARQEQEAQQAQLEQAHMAAQAAGQAAPALEAIQGGRRAA